MTDCCNNTVHCSRGPPEWVRKRFQERCCLKDPASSCPFTDSPTTSFPQHQPHWLRHAHHPNVNESHSFCPSKTRHQRFSCFRDFGEESPMSHDHFGSRFDKVSPFWLRNRCHVNTGCQETSNNNMGPPKSVILEMLGLKRQHLNSKLNFIDSRIEKLKEEIKENEPTSKTSEN